MANNSITWRELYAIVVAVATWGLKLTGKKVLIYCDNEAVTFILKKGTSKDDNIMTLVRKLFFLCADYNVELTALHIVGIKNEIADALSRGDLEHFRDLAPDANLGPSTSLTP